MLSINRANVAVVALLLACVAADSGVAKPKSDAPATTRRAGLTPPAMCGRWSYGSVSPTTYWDASTGRFAGNARGAAGILEFDDAGHYTEYVYLEMKTYGLTSKCWTVHSGDVTFNGDRMTLSPTSGHYNTWINDQPKTDRDMTADERAKLTKTYRWTLTRDDAGRETLTIPFEDGSKFEYRRAERE